MTSHESLKVDKSFGIFIHVFCEAHTKEAKKKGLKIVSHLKGPKYHGTPPAQENPPLQDTFQMDPNRAKITFGNGKGGNSPLLKAKHIVDVPKGLKFRNKCLPMAFILACSGKRKFKSRENFRDMDLQETKYSKIKLSLKTKKALLTEYVRVSKVGGKENPLKDDVKKMTTDCLDWLAEHYGCNVFVHKVQEGTKDDSFVHKYPSKVNFRWPKIHLLETNTDNEDIKHLSVIRKVKSQGLKYGNKKAILYKICYSNHSLLS